MEHMMLLGEGGGGGFDLTSWSKPCLLDSVDAFETRRAAAARAPLISLRTMRDMRVRLETFDLDSESAAAVLCEAAN
jgi:hypothetical protein